MRGELSRSANSEEKEKKQTKRPDSTARTNGSGTESPAVPLAPSSPLFIAGSLGPTTRTASLSPDVRDPGYRAVTFDDLAAAYYEQVSALVEGGVDILLAETVFDTLNLKACLFAIEDYFQKHGRRLPLMVSVTMTRPSGRTLSGQTLEAFWISIAHADLFSVGINSRWAPD